MHGDASLASLIKDHGDRWVIEHTGVGTAWVAARRDGGDIRIIGGPVLRGGSRLSSEQFDELLAMLAAANGVVVYLFEDEEVLRDRLSMSLHQYPRHALVMDNLTALLEQYDKVIGYIETMLPVIAVHSSASPPGVLPPELARIATPDPAARGSVVRSLDPGSLPEVDEDRGDAAGNAQAKATAFAAASGQTCLAMDAALALPELPASLQPGVHVRRCRVPPNDPPTTRCLTTTSRCVTGSADGSRPAGHWASRSDLRTGAASTGKPQSSGCSCRQGRYIAGPASHSTHFSRMYPPGATWPSFPVPRRRHYGRTPSEHRSRRSLPTRPS
jgi:hypothetical protein